LKRGLLFLVKIKKGIFLNSNMKIKEKGKVSFNLSFFYFPFFIFLKGGGDE